MQIAEFNGDLKQDVMSRESMFLPIKNSYASCSRFMQPVPIGKEINATNVIHMRACIRL